MKAEDAISKKPTPYKVICHKCGPTFMNRKGYSYQLDFPDSRWNCPQCGTSIGVEFDDENYESYWDELE